MIRIPGKIPITIAPTFWIFAALIGYLQTQSLLGSIIWIAIIFISVIVHEFGHALTALLFGQHPKIDLVALGGLTSHEGAKLTLWKQFFIVLNGPLFGFLLGILAMIISTIPPVEESNAVHLIKAFQNINFFWTVINLLPVLPLDGGQLSRIVFEAFFGIKGFRYSLYLSLIISGIIALGSFLYGEFFLGTFFFLFAFQSIEGLRQVKQLREGDRSETLKESLSRAENLLKEGKKEEAYVLLEEINHKASEGIIHAISTQYLAFLEFERANLEKCYALLVSIRPQLSDEGLCLLHRVAFEKGDFPLVVELSGPCFQCMPTPEAALRNAEACALLAESSAALGWLKTAKQEGVENLKEIVNDRPFDTIRHDPHFQAFINTL